MKRVGFEAYENSYKVIQDKFVQTIKGLNIVTFNSL